MRLKLMRGAKRKAISASGVNRSIWMDLLDSRLWVLYYYYLQAPLRPAEAMVVYVT